jgi:UPF0755 protein
LGICSVLAALGCYSFLNSPVITSEEGYKYKVSAGSTYKIVSAELHQQHILKHPLLFNLLFRLRGDTHHLKAGEYYFARGELPGNLIDQMVYGTGLVYHSVTIVPGTNFRQLRTLINSNPEIAHLSENMSDADLMKKLGLQGIFPEGRFFPDTYYFVAGSSDLVLLKRAYTLMQQKLLKSWENRASNLPFRTPYDALIAASIIEKEAYLSDELPIIAGVMTNRLRKGILLQFDPTVIYGVGLQYHGTIYKHDLRATDNPYNTYVHKGLPPTPISMPGRLAIDAVMHPDENNYLYFVARGDGGHQFSSTLAQHSVAVRTARSNHSWYFNTALVKQYLIKTIQQQSVVSFPRRRESISSNQSVYRSNDGFPPARE